ncbi:hypothetical protein N8D56_10035 [Devosia sp. A8/3-2]|nr:hypothetical protein N8D56_10035 [Devosia sp. A8/3-2]
MARLTIHHRRLLATGLVLCGSGVPAVIVAQDVLTMSNEQQKDWLTSFVQDRLSTPERQISLSNIDGVLGSNVSVREITISDAEGVWLRVNNATLTGTGRPCSRASSMCSRSRPIPSNICATRFQPRAPTCLRPKPARCKSPNSLSR